MDQMVACPDCGTPNRASADLCAQCWRALSDDAISKIPAAAFATTAAASPARLAPPPPVTPGRTVPASRPAPEPVKPREADPGAVPYFAPAGSFVAPTPTGYSAPVETTPVAAPAGKAPWGALTALALVLAVLGGGYYFFFGRSSGTFSPEDGAYTVTLPEGWERSPEEEARRASVDLVVQPGDEEHTMIVAAHSPVPEGVGRDQVRMVLGFLQQFLPKIPGMSISPIQESTLVTGDGISAYETTATASGPGGSAKMRMVAVVDDASSNLVFMMVACVSDACTAADPAFADMAATLEFSS